VGAARVCCASTLRRWVGLRKITANYREIDRVEASGSGSTDVAPSVGAGVAAGRLEPTGGAMRF
jgi:hypothetical protein